MKDRLVRTFYALFSVCFTMVILSSIIKNDSFKPVWLIAVKSALFGAFDRGVLLDVKI